LPAPYALICGTVAASLVSLAVLGPASAGDDAPIDDAQNPIVQNFAVHGQFTYTDQQVGGFSAPYRGPNSLTPDTGAETVDATLFLGARLWPGSELWVTPEIDQGFGLDDTLGVAGFPSGEAYKIGKNQPYFRLQRLFVRQTFDLDGRRESFDPSQLQLGGAHSPDRVVLTVGKISVVDIFDNNRYAHDARNDFLNWAAIDAGTFDYAADSWGYTAGAVIEWYREPWAARFGLFDLSDVPNSPSSSREVTGWPAARDGCAWRHSTAADAWDCWMTRSRSAGPPIRPRTSRRCADTGNGWALTSIWSRN
jgi:high affinity Mn2+ porin